MDAATTERLITLIDKIEAEHGAATRLHIVLEDLSLDADSIRWCMDNETLTEDEQACADALLKLSEDDREALVNRTNYGMIN